MYEVIFYKGSFLFGETVSVKVSANSHESALKKARKRGYLLKDGWKWHSTMPLSH